MCGECGTGEARFGLSLPKLTAFSGHVHFAIGFRSGGFDDGWFEALESGGGGACDFDGGSVEVGGGGDCDEVGG